MRIHQTVNAGHAKSVKICFVQIHYKGICFIWIIIRKKWIISLSFARHTCAYPATHSFFKKNVSYLYIRQECKFDTGQSKHCMPAQTGSGEVMCRI
nr:unnamed protein product [Callosobruchus analis]